MNVALHTIEICAGVGMLGEGLRAGLAPALDKTAESGLRGVADGLASGMDHCRSQRLKCVGNGVVELCAAAAVVVLVQRMKEAA